MPPMPARPGTRTLLRALGRRLPRTRGELRVAGLHDEVVVRRDRWGIPHVEAADDADAWFALGFCHGQDRAFQLELLARAGRGLLAELLGPAALPIDRLSRTLGFRRLAMAQVSHLDPDVVATIEAYVAGINAAAGCTPRPHELVLLRAERTAWTIEDVLAFEGLQSLALAGSWDTELARQAILDADGPEALAAVEPAYGPWLPVVTPSGAQAGEPVARLAADLASCGTWSAVRVDRTRGRSTDRGRRRAHRSSPTTRTSARASRRRGTSPTCARPNGSWPARRSSGPRRFRPATTATPPGASPPPAPTRPTSSGRSSPPTAASRAGRMVRSRSSGSSRRSRCAARTRSLRRCESPRVGRS